MSDPIPQLPQVRRQPLVLGVVLALPLWALVALGLWWAL